MHYANIKWNSIENGDGVRVSLFVSGCRICCKGCFNKVAWDFKYGNEFDEEIQNKIIEYSKNDFITGLTVLGGEPFDIQNQPAIATFLTKYKQEVNKSVWCYTGYTYETDILDPNGKAHCEYTQQMLDNIDTLVDGNFIQEQKDISLKFRGSSNQRIIYLKEDKHE